MKLLRRSLAVAAGAVIAALASAGTVLAHAELVESTPAAGSHLAKPPPLISLRFSERVALLKDPVVLLDADGARVEIGEPSADGAVVTASVPDLPEGAYVVDWQVVSADGHPVAGAFTFTVGNATPIDPSTLTPTGSAATSGTDELILWRALTYAGFAVVLGTWAFVLFCWPDGRRDRLISLLAAGGAAVALVAAAIRTMTETAVLDASLAETLDLRSGRAWLGLVILAALAFGVGPLLRSPLGRGALGWLWAAAAVAVGTAIALAGHGASGRVPIGGTVLTVLHVAAASVWIGGLAALACCLAAVDRPTAWGVAARFSAMAIWLVAVLATTGTVQAIRQLDGFDALTGSDYGRALLVKLAIVAILLIVATISRLAVRRSATPATASVAVSRLRRTVVAELILAGAIFGVTGWLAGASPITEATSSGPVTVSGPDSTGVATASATIIPATVGPNSVEATIDYPRHRAPREVTMQLRPADGRIAPLDVPTFLMPGMAMSDRVDVPFAGAWILTIDARYGKFDVLTFELPVTIR